MSPLWIAAIGLGYLVFVAFLLLVVQPKSRSLRVDRIAHTVGLPLTDDIEPVVRGTQRAGVRMGFLSIAIGIVLATIYSLLRQVDSPIQVVWIDFTGVIAAAGIGNALATLVREDARQKHSVRVARLNAVSLSDYRSDFEQWAPRLVVAIALVGLAIRGAIYPLGYASVPPFLYVYAAVMVASLLVYEIASRALIRSGQPASSELDLAWDDALKSRALVGIALAPLILGGYLGIAAWVFYPPTHSGATAIGSQIEIAFQFAGLALMLASILASSAAKSRTRYLRRLWPQLEGGAQP